MFHSIIKSQLTIVSSITARSIRIRCFAGSASDLNSFKTGLNDNQKPLKNTNAEQMTNNASKLVDTIEKETSKLNKDKDREHANSTIKEYLDTIIESENFQNLKKELVKFNENRAKAADNYSRSFSQKLDYNVKELKNSLSIASKIVNDITGYTKVIQLKDIITQNELNLRNLRKAISEAKAQHNAASEERISSQQQINELLERKHNWSPQDLEKFTGLYRSDHELEKQVQETAEAVRLLEGKEDETHNELIQSIMNRYHEEQVWSDKIRQFSTWGTLLIMAVNLLLVVLVQLVFEPWKRARLVNSFELKVKDLFANNERMDLDLKDLKEETIKSQAIMIEKITQHQKDEEEKIVTDNRQTIKTSLLPGGYSFKSLSNWIKSLFGILYPWSTDGLVNDTFLVTKSDLQIFICILSAFSISLGLITKTLI